MLQMGKGFFRGIVGILWWRMKAQLIQLIWAPESTMVVVVIVFRVVGESMTEMGMYRDCFLHFVDLGMMGEEVGGVKGVMGSGAAVDGDGSEGVSGMGSTGRAVKWFKGWGEGIVGLGEVGRVEGVKGLEGPGNFWIMCPDCLHRKQSPFLVHRSHSLGVKDAK